jgi:hypothetical protein
MSGPGAGHVWLAGYVRAIGRTCPIKTASAVPETSKTAQKMIFNGFWRRANIIYICVAHGHVLTNKKKYIYDLKPIESQSMDKILRKKDF